MTAESIEELAPRTEDEVRAHLAAGKLVEGLQHMSPEYLKGIRRILTVSADTELVSAPSYLRAAQHRAEPDARVVADADVADQDRGRRQPDVATDGGGHAVELHQERPA